MTAEAKASPTPNSSNVIWIADYRPPTRGWNQTNRKAGVVQDSLMLAAIDAIGFTAQK